MEYCAFLRVDDEIARFCEAGSYLTDTQVYKPFLVYWRQMAPSESSENPTITTVEIPRSLSIPEVRKNEPLSDEEMGNLLAAIGNNEAKALTLIAMKRGSIYTPKRLRKAVWEIQGDKKGWPISDMAVLGYCRFSFEDIGLVAKSVSDSIRGTWGYIKTDYGEEQGDALAGLLLDFSLNHEGVSLYQIFGATQSTSEEREVDSSAGKTEFKTRSPLRRLRVLWELVTSEGQMSVTTLSKLLDENPDMINAHLERLSVFNLVHFETTKFGEEITAYQLSENLPDQPPTLLFHRPTLTKSMYELISSDPNKTWGTHELIEAINTKRKAVNKLPLSRPNARFVGILKHLEREGYVTQIGFKGEERSKVWVDEDQRVVLIDILTLIDNFQRQDPEVLREGRLLAANFTGTEFSKLWAKAKKYSSMANKVPREDSRNEVLDYLREHPKSTTAQLTTYLSKIQERNVAQANTRFLLNELRNSGLVAKSQDKVVKWSVSSQQEN